VSVFGSSLKSTVTGLAVATLDTSHVGKRSRVSRDGFFVHLVTAGI
jgi:hypothetical protein